MTVLTTITASDMLAALKKWGITPRFYKADWQSHNRNSVQTWGRLNGFVVHNFASDIADSSSLDYLYRGDSARQLPGPLSQFAITDDGQVWVIGWGVANHCKSVDNDTHALVLKNAMPRDRDVKPNTNGSESSGWVSGNQHYIGCEMTYGNKGPTAAQRASIVRLAAAMMDMLGGISGGYTGGSVIGHREATTTRSDPQAMPMGPVRTSIDALLKKGPGAAPAPAPTPPPPTSTVKATTTVLTLNPDINVRAATTQVIAKTTPVAGGTHIYEYQQADKTWKEFKRLSVPASGLTTFDWRFGSTHGVRVRFVPGDSKTFGGSQDADLITSVSLRDILSRLGALEGK